VPVLVCRDEVVERNAEQAADLEGWLETALVEGMDEVLNGVDEVHVSVEAEPRKARLSEEGA
jgi:hypothetical protein